jgi:hypothetical protein
MSAENVVRRLADALRFELPFETRGSNLVVRPLEATGTLQLGTDDHTLDLVVNSSDVQVEIGSTLRITTESGAEIDLDADGNFDAGRKVTNVTENTTLDANSWNGILTNRGAGDAVTITLPNDAPVGAWFEYHGVADQNVTFATETVETLIVLNNAAASSLALSTGGEKIGAMARGVYDGTRWHAVAVSGTGTVA